MSKGFSLAFFIKVLYNKKRNEVKLCQKSKKQKKIIK